MCRTVLPLATMFLLSCIGQQHNILLSHSATHRAIIYREIEIRQPSGPVLWQGVSDNTGRIYTPASLQSEPVQIHVRGFQTVTARKFERILRKGFVLDLQALPPGQDPPQSPNPAYQRQPDASVTVIDATTAKPVANRRLILREAEYCEQPNPDCPPGEAIWSGQTDPSGIIGVSKQTVSLAFTIHVDGYQPIRAWDLRNILRNARTELRLTPQ
ncbi:MAG: hypothetical protein U0R19_26810 [Bryobacteraceae bacterium]